MEKLHLDRQTTDGTQFTIAQLAELCPSAITEVTDPNTGKVSRKVNFTILRQMLGDLAIENPHEVYDFTWVGKTAAAREAAQPITKTLRPYPNESEDWENTQNLYIEGDNLQVLKLLQESYDRSVKMIYIDPPYNTGKDFVYHDDFHQTQEEYDEAAGAKDELDNRFRQNTNSNGRFHSDWCSMMYARLLVCRNMLADDGVIFISIDNDELVNLKKIADEVFGEQNFVEVFSWVKTSTPPSLATKSRKTNEYILCYEKNKNNIKYNGELLDGGDQPLLNSGNSLAELKFPKDKVLFNTGKFPNGQYKAFSSDRVSLLTDIEIVDGHATTDFILRGEFKWTQDFLNAEIEQGTTFVIKTQELSIRFIRSGEGYKRPTNFIKEKYTSPLIDKPSCSVGPNENASSALSNLMDGCEVFSYPKPVSLIQYLVNFICNDNDIVLDFFSGSATTAEAVMSYNVLHNTRLRHIMVQFPENLDENLKTADEKSKILVQNGIKFLDKIGKQHLITELAKERIRRAGKKIKEEAGLIDANLDTGFRVLKLDDTNYKQVAFTPDQLSQGMLDGLIDNIKDDRNELDLLFECMLRWGVKLSKPIRKTVVDGCAILNVDEGDLVACLDRDSRITEPVIDAIAEMNPLRVVLLDTAFSEAAHKMNIYEQFKQRLCWTDSDAAQKIRVI